MVTESLRRVVAVLLATAALVYAGAGFAADLRPDQRAAVEKILAGVDPSMREAMRPQIEQSVAILSPEQVAKLIGNVDKNAARAAAPKEAPRPKRSARKASAEDLAYNRAQYEPAIRRNWQSQKAFDDFVDAELKAKCPDRDKYAVFGPAERYELRPLSPEWPHASWNADTDVQVLGSSRVPQDGRYDFDFSKVRTDFDKRAVASAIANACAEWSKQAAAFQQKASTHMKSNQSSAAFKLERSASAKVDRIEDRLEAVLNMQAPSANHALLEALRSAKRVK